MSLRIALIIRPGTREDALAELKAAVEELRGEGHRVTPRVTFEEGDGRRLALAAARSRYDLIVAAGGDGTVNEVVNGLARSSNLPRLGIVPLGTANDFAAGLRLPTTVREAMRTAVEGRARTVDVARVNERYFLNVSTGGFGAEATESTSPDSKRRLGPLAYLVTGVREFVELRPVGGRFLVDGEVFHEGDFLLFAVGNARQTGGGSLLTPRAEFGDGKLDLMLVPDLPRMDFLALLPDLRAGTHLKSPDVRYVQAAEIDVASDRDLHVHVDGEPIHAHRLRYRLSDRPLTLMVPLLD